MADHDTGSQPAADSPELSAKTLIPKDAYAVLDIIGQTPWLTASEIARIYSQRFPSQEMTREQINDYLESDISSFVVQDSLYRWAPKSSHTKLSRGGSEALAPEGSVSRLSRFYFDCIAQDNNEGAVFELSGQDYYEVKELAVLTDSMNWSDEPKVKALLQKVRLSSDKENAWIGYPVRVFLKDGRMHCAPLFIWQVELHRDSNKVGVVDAVPAINYEFLKSIYLLDKNEVVSTVAELMRDLGLAEVNPNFEMDEVFNRLKRIRMDSWDWQETLNPSSLGGKDWLYNVKTEGTYNRAVVFKSPKLGYTLGLESELKHLGTKLEESKSIGTALHDWAYGELEEPAQEQLEAESKKVILEVVPMNQEQREAVHSAFVRKLTVVTGPPGTGKSQVVTNILATAAWRGEKVLFASKNAKAVDVVESRVNSLTSKPVLLRTGSNEHQIKLAEALRQILSSKADSDRVALYEEALSRHVSLVARLKALESQRDALLHSRNTADSFEHQTEPLRQKLGEVFFAQRSDKETMAALSALQRCAHQTLELEGAESSLFQKLVVALFRSRKIEDLRINLKRLNEHLVRLGLEPFDIDFGIDFDHLFAHGDKLADKLESCRNAQKYQAAVDALLNSQTLETIALETAKTQTALQENSAVLWREWVALSASRISNEQRKHLGDYLALLDAKLSYASSNELERDLRQRHTEVMKYLGCWAVSSLSAKGKLQLEPATFDLVVFDEASQCDIASALPLLFRAKRAVIIGDPQQLRHISAISLQKEMDLKRKHQMAELGSSWSYAMSSLYDRAASLVPQGGLFHLKDHHRSHLDIIDFSNSKFYERSLRVATRYERLNSPDKSKTLGVQWVHVPERGGKLSAELESQKAIEVLEDLIDKQGFKGTIGIVCPFKHQVYVMERLIAKKEKLRQAKATHALLIDTTHKFQGDERDVMIFSPGIGPHLTPDSKQFLLQNGNLFNVAITRARAMLYVVSNDNYALSCGIDYMEQFANHVIKRHEVKKESVAQKTLRLDNPWVLKLRQVAEAAGLFLQPGVTVDQYELDLTVEVNGVKLNIELDTERYHRGWNKELAQREILRTQRLNELGWTVRRVWLYELRDRPAELQRWLEDWALSARKIPR